MRTVGWIPAVEEENKAKAVVNETAAKAISETVEVKKTTKKKKVEE